MLNVISNHKNLLFNSILVSFCLFNVLIGAESSVTDKYDKMSVDIEKDEEKQGVTGFLRQFNNLPTSLQNHTQTKQHIATNLTSVTSVLSDPVFRTSEVQEFLLNIYKKEIEEHKKGNFVFYHGRRIFWNFISDIYKELWNITYENKLDKDYTFLKFNNRFEINTLIFNLIFSRNQLFMNHALFGNCHSLTGACSIRDFWACNSNILQGNEGPITLVAFAQFNLKDLYLKYKESLENLKQLHAKISKHGELLLISIPESKIHLIQAYSLGEPATIYIDGKKETNIKKIMETLKNNPKSITVSNKSLERRKQQYEEKEFPYPYDNYLEFVLPFSSSYACDIKTGPKITSFILNDEAATNEYEKLKDEIFNQIKEDFNKLSKIKNFAQRHPYAVASLATVVIAGIGAQYLKSKL